MFEGKDRHVAMQGETGLSLPLDQAPGGYSCRQRACSVRALLPLPPYCSWTARSVSRRARSISGARQEESSLQRDLGCGALRG